MDSRQTGLDLFTARLTIIEEIEQPASKFTQDMVEDFTVLDARHMEVLLISS